MAFKTLEVVVMVVALIVLPTDILWLGFVVLFLMATQSALLSPAKYGVLPEVFDDTQLSRANGLVEMATFVAIILGTLVGGMLFDVWGGQKLFLGIALLSIAIMGWLAIWRLPRVPTSGAKEEFPINPWSKIWAGSSRIFSDKRLRIVVVGIIWFWFLGALLQLNLIVLVPKVLVRSPVNTDIVNFLSGFGFNNGTITGLMQAFLALGIGVGTLLAGRLSEDRIELGLVPLGALGIGIGAIYMAFAVPSMIHVGFALILSGISAGLFIIPLTASLQSIAGRQEKGTLIATTNFLLTIGIILASICLWSFHDLLDLNIKNIILIFGLLTVAITSYAVYLLPEIFVRFTLWILTHSIYKITAIDRKNVPEKGPALIVSNHVSYADGLVVGASLNRPVRFMLASGIYHLKALNWLFRLMKAIPVYPGRKVLQTIEEARSALQNGEVVCIFAEGWLTRSGNTLPFQRGLEKIVAGLDVPIIPANLDGVWNSMFSANKRRSFIKFPYPVTVRFGKAMPTASQAWEVRQSVKKLEAASFPTRKAVQNILPKKFIKSAKWAWWKLCIADSSGLRLSYGKTLVASILISKKLRKYCHNQQMVGILLPASVPGALANIAISLMGKVAVNLNFTAGKASLNSAIAQCQIKTIITSRKFLARINIEPQDNMLFFEDFATTHTLDQKIIALLQALLLPTGILWRTLCTESIKPESMATVIFSSGSTGEPKGIMLSHQNILCNIEGVAQVFPYEKNDRFMGVLPLFHSFGYTGTLWFPLVKRLATIFHFNPIDAKTICKLVAQYKASFLISTPTFYQAYTRTCNKSDFASIKYAIVGAEKLRKSVAASFKEKFGFDLFEGYGCSETAPIVAVNTPDVMVGKQIGHKFGTAGNTLPGVAAIIVDPETFAELPINQEGLLLIKGGNLMLGYLGQPERTKKAFHDGWYITRDIASLDEGGFITIVDRLERFSKIGGEMVPHLKVEKEINQIIGESNSVVVSIPDEKKGEVLAALYVHPTITHQVLWTKLNALDLPKLWIPKSNMLFAVEALPVLGSGKIDLRTSKDLVMQNLNT